MALLVTKMETQEEDQEESQSLGLLGLKCLWDVLLAQMLRGEESGPGKTQELGSCGMVGAMEVNEIVRGRMGRV
jgi:hypothetical protein